METYPIGGERTEAQLDEHGALFLATFPAAVET